AEDGIRDRNVTGVQTCALPIFQKHNHGCTREESTLRPYLPDCTPATGSISSRGLVPLHRTIDQFHHREVVNDLLNGKTEAGGVTPPTKTELHQWYDKVSEVRPQTQQTRKTRGTRCTREGRAWYGH